MKITLDNHISTHSLERLFVRPSVNLSVGLVGWSESVVYHVIASNWYWLTVGQGLLSL